jgi:hypothetical protein
MGESYGWGQSADPQIGATVEAGMMREFARMKSDPRPGIKAFGVRYVALQTARPDPDYLKRGWTCLKLDRTGGSGARISDAVMPYMDRARAKRRMPG